MADNSVRGKAALFLTLVFLLGIVLGVLGTRVALEHNWGTRWLMSRRDYVADLTREVGLTADQRKQVEGILDDARGKFRAINEQSRPQVEAVRKETRDRIRALLTAEQRAKFETFVQRLDEERRRRENH